MIELLSSSRCSGSGVAVDSWICCSRRRKTLHGWMLGADSIHDRENSSNTGVRGSYLGHWGLMGSKGHRMQSPSSFILMLLGIWGDGDICKGNHSERGVTLGLSRWAHTSLDDTVQGLVFGGSDEMKETRRTNRVEGIVGGSRDIGVSICVGNGSGGVSKILIEDAGGWNRIFPIDVKGIYVCVWVGVNHSVGLHLKSLVVNVYGRIERSGEVSFHDEQRLHLKVDSKKVCSVIWLWSAKRSRVLDANDDRQR